MPRASDRALWRDGLMAVELTHRIIVEGGAAAVRKFKRDVARPRVPFSFEALWRMGRFAGDPPCDPYNLTGFRVRPIWRRRAEVRYTFLTRNMGMDDLLARVSRRRPNLLFRLASMADDGDVEAFLIRRGRRRRREAPEWLREYHYHSVALANGTSRDSLDEDDDNWFLQWDAQWAILDDAVNLWNDVAIRQMPPEPEEWYGRRVRLMEDEQEKAIYELSKQIDWDEVERAERGES